VEFSVRVQSIGMESEKRVWERQGKENLYYQETRHKRIETHGSMIKSL
jgi:hypothetical protein